MISNIILHSFNFVFSGFPVHPSEVSPVSLGAVGWSQTAKTIQSMTKQWVMLQGTQDKYNIVPKRIRHPDTFCWAHSEVYNLSTKTWGSSCSYHLLPLLRFLTGLKSFCNWLSSDSASNTTVCYLALSLQSNSASIKPYHKCKCQVCLWQRLVSYFTWVHRYQISKRLHNQPKQKWFVHFICSVM